MIKKVFRQMLVTQIISAMTVMLCMLVDSIMIGRFLGVNSMTAYGLATPVLLVFAAFGSMLSAGIQVMCGKTMGAGDAEATNGCFTVSVFLSSVVSVVGVAAVLIFTDPICVLLGAVRGTEVFDLTRDYLRGFIIGAPAFIFAQIMVPYMQISGNRMRLVVAVIAMTVADIALDVLNVTVIKWSTLGMGLASSASYYIAFFIGVVYFFKKKCMFRFRASLIRLRTCLDLLKYGIPTVINQISLVLLVFVLNKVLLDVGGDAAVAAYSVISTVGNICYCVGSGIGSVALLLSSIFYTDEDKTELRSLVKTMSFYAVVLNAALIVIVMLLAPVLVALFLNGEDSANAADMAALGLRLFSLSLLPCAVNTTYKNYLQGINKTGFSESISVMQNFTFTALFAFLLSRFAGTTGVWLGFVCGELLTLIVIAAVVFLKNKSFSFTAKTFSLLPDDFGASEEDCFEISASSLEEVVAASAASADFCREHGESERNCIFIPLCIEEMAANIVTHGFTKDKKDHTLDIRLLFKDGKRLIRIRDNCVNFDPTHYLELHKADDPTSHCGIRMVMKMVRSANYVNSLGLNNLTLVL